MNDVQQAINDLQELQIDPAVTGPLIQRLQTEGLTDAVRQTLVQVLEDAYKESALTVAMAEHVQQMDQATDDRLSGQLNTYYDQVEQQLAAAEQQYDQSASTQQPSIEVQADPVQQPVVSAPSEPTVAQPVSVETPPLTVPETAAVAPVVQQIEPPPVAPAKPVAVPEPAVTEPAPAATLANPALPVEDSDWLKLLDDVNTTAAEAPPAPGPTAAPPAPSPQPSP
ncbi:hypothetical protein HY523_00605 [Candidatus Berkelbacteria bacterium]|nr:hypothetical protein [Candidatus Berkelbacteria bacterium]